MFDIVMPIAKWETLAPLLTDMKPAALNAIKPIVDRFREDSTEVSPIGKPRPPTANVAGSLKSTAKKATSSRNLTRTTVKTRTEAPVHIEEEETKDAF